MRRRKLLAGGVPALALGSGCLGILTTKDIPLYFANDAREAFEVTATVSNQNSDEEVFNETITVPSGERIERTLKNIKKSETYLLEASSNTGQTFEGTFNTTDEALKLTITDDGELAMYHLVS